MHPKARTEQVLVQEVPNETLIYDLQKAKVHCLNRTSSLVWRHCDGKTSRAELTRIVEKEFAVTNADEIVALALEQLHRRNLVELPGEAWTTVHRANRRSILKKLAMAATLPLIMTVTAPGARAQFSFVNRENSFVACPTGRCRSSAFNSDCFTFCIPISGAQNALNALCIASVPPTVQNPCPGFCTCPPPNNVP
jgi:hypothetical protein